MSELDTCWVCTPGGKAHVAMSAMDAWFRIDEVAETDFPWVRFDMPNGGTAHFRIEDITCINSHVEPKRDVREHFNNRPY